MIQRAQALRWVGEEKLAEARRNEVDPSCVVRFSRCKLGALDLCCKLCSKLARAFAAERDARDATRRARRDAGGAHAYYVQKLSARSAGSAACADLALPAVTTTAFSTFARAFC